MIKAAIILCLFFLARLTGAQINFAPERFKDNTDISLKDFKIKYKLNDYSHALYYAILYYPQLKNIRFVVVNKKMDMVMQVRPTLFSSFRKPEKRKYKIYINKSNTKGIPTPGEFTFNAQVGIFGHELGHVCDYLTMRFGRLIRTGSHYHRPDFKKTMEQKTDKMALENGLGWQLYDYATQWYGLDEKYNTYIEKKKKFYLNPTEMLSIMLEMGYK
jgi:hypothetical protein